MNISGLTQSSSLYNLTATTQTQSTSQTLADILKELSSQKDELSISDEAKALSQMPKPEKVDFAEMSDEDLVSFLQNMQEKTGFIPGIDDADSSTDVTALTAEQLQSVRDTFMSMMHTRAQEMMQNMNISRAVSAYEEVGTPSI